MPAWLLLGSNTATEAMGAHFLRRNRVRRTGFEFVSTGIELGAQDLSSFPQELSSVSTGIELGAQGELKSCVSNSIPGETNSNPVRPNSIPVETNSNPVGWTWFLWKKVSLRGFRTQQSFSHYQLFKAV